MGSDGTGKTMGSSGEVEGFPTAVGENEYVEACFGTMSMAVVPIRTARR